MGTQYYCKNQKRRQRVLDHSTLNGIDYLEVLDRQAPSGSPRQRTLLVRCLKSVPSDFTAKNIRIEGGVRVKSISVEWAYPAALIPNHILTQEEAQFLSSLQSTNHLLVVRTSSSGDFSSYRLFLARSSTDSDPPEGFDPVLSEVEFSFKVECPSEFDCKSEIVCPAEIFPQPHIDYLAKDYASLRRLMLDRLSIIMPDWKERCPGDLGIALVELLAYAGDYLSYYQDSVATEAYLGTARKRVSLRRHARLLDYYIHDGCNSRVWVCLDVSEGKPLLLRGWDEKEKFRTRLLTRCAEGTVVRNDDWQELVSTRCPEVFELLYDITLYPSHNSIKFYTWSDEQCCLPKGATRAHLVDSPVEKERLHLQAGDVLIFEELLGIGTGLEADADPSHRHAVRLIQVRSHLTDPLTGDPIVEVIWHPEDALPFPLCISSSISGKLLTDISCARGNVVLADHGLTIEDDSLIPKLVPSRGRYRPRLPRKDITFRSPYDHQEALQQSASAIKRQELREALPAVLLTGDGDLWTPRRDLLNSDRFSPEFVVEMEDDTAAYLRFGDDVLGKRPSPGASLKASYRVGNGSAGNVGAEAISLIVAQNADRIKMVRNPLPAQGGIDTEPTSQVRLYAPYAFRKKERAVTQDDYAEIVQQHPEVQKAVATLRWTGSWYTIFLALDRKGGREVDLEFKRELLAFLEQFRLAGHDIEIDSPSFVPLEIAFTVCVAPGYLCENVKQALLDIFSNFDHPNGRRGFFHPDNFTFGQPVYLSSVIASAMEVPGVLWIDASEQDHHRFQRWGQPSRGEINEGMITFDRLEIARLDNDPNSPENGRIDFFMVGGL